MKTITILLLWTLLWRSNAAEIAFLSTSKQGHPDIYVFELCMFDLDADMNKKLQEGKPQLFEYSKQIIPTLTILKNGKEYKLFYLIKQKGKYGFFPCTFQFDGISFYNIKADVLNAIVIDTLNLRLPIPKVEDKK